MITMPTIFPVTCHTDFVGVGSTFVVIQGQQENGLKYLEVALQKGATSLILQQNIVLTEQHKNLIDQYNVQISYVENARIALAQLSAQAAGFPAQKLKLLGVTGTKGKSSTVHMLYYLLQQLGYKVAQIGTVENKILATVLPKNLTTPQPDYLHQFFKLCVQSGVEYVVMEVAAQALTFNRLETLQFEGVIFTNLDREHGELYPDMEQYFATKCQLFDFVKSGGCVVANQDDVWGKRILSPRYDYIHNHSGRTDIQDDCSTHPECSTKRMCSRMYRRAISTITYCPFTNYSITPKNFPGIFNQQNLNGALTLLEKLGISFSDLELQTLSDQIPALRGRLERYDLETGVQVYIDYAHTPGSFASLFQTVKNWNKKLCVVFGAGGGKDSSKRPLMGAIAAQYADFIIITSDNPRHEDPGIIAQQIFAGVPQDQQNKVIIKLDRKEAIEYACHSFGAEWVILLLGKGPDEYQIIGDKKEYFSELALIKTLQKRPVA